MKRIGLVRMVYELEFELKVNFHFESSKVKNISSKEYAKLFPLDNDEYFDDKESRTLFGTVIPETKKRNSNFGYLIIESTFDLEEYDSLLEGSANIRPQLLVIHGLLTFLTKHIFVSFQSFSSTHFLVKKHISATLNSIKLKSDKIEYTEDLKIILGTIANSSYEKKVLIYTLFERWRKALYLELESEESYIHLDESVLAYIHILEVLSDEYKGIIKKKVKDRKILLINEIIECIRNAESPNVKQISKLLTEINDNQVTLKSKVSQMLIELNLDCLKSQNIVNRFVLHRNAIAHGRKDIYQDKVVYPLRPFFSLIKDIDENLEAIKILSAKTISNYFGLYAWEEEWDFLLFSELTPFTEVEEFVNNKEYETITPKDFMNGKVQGINPWTINRYYIKNKIKYSELEKILRNTFLNVNINKENCRILFDTAISLADSTIKELSEKAKLIVQKVDQNNWYFQSNLRDVLKDFEYYGKPLIWYGEYLTFR